MSKALDFTCSCCGDRHDGLPLSYATEAPDYWKPGMEDDSLNLLSSDQCVIQGRAFFLRGLIEIPLVDADDVFTWNVWVSLSQENFIRACEFWGIPGRESEPPYFGWLSTELSIYSPSTINLKTNLHTRPVGERPVIELEPTDHPLAVEQRTGITLDRARQIAEILLHGGAARH
ncbi:DUF2199 domain-containing protein [Herbidospora galbida]|uniref:DUF2199 domain-containing protein n=1 Tax=Herbidospora galbida TaxID=2575442 RepID=A0A4U3MH76_9ACTN|nr:DUF2199 domain-containing protein [Herbidospora galbida]TKK87969.1 DUF2199 domain-containing protein [Herbidospora galbida]